MIGVSLHHFFPTVVGGVSYWIKGVDDDNSQVIADLFRLQCNRIKSIGNYCHFHLIIFIEKKSDNK
jgi:hypothetical protein